MFLERGSRSAPLPCISPANRGYQRKLFGRLAHGAEVNARDSSGSTLSMSAAWKGQTDIAAILLDRGADRSRATRIPV